MQRKVVDEASRRKKQRLLTAGGIAVAVAGVLVFLIEKFYDPEARAREKAIAAEVARMAEQQKVTDNLTLIEVDIENAIMNNELDVARAELAKLVEKSPDASAPRIPAGRPSIAPPSCRSWARRPVDGAGPGRPAPPPAAVAAPNPRTACRSNARPHALPNASPRAPPERTRPAAHLAGLAAAATAHLWRADRRTAARADHSARRAHQFAAHDAANRAAPDNFQWPHGRSQRLRGRPRHRVRLRAAG